VTIINPVDAFRLNHKEKRRVVLRSAAKLEWIKDLLSNPQGVELAEMMDKVNPQKNESTP
jgi:hypothetical protein